MRNALSLSMKLTAFADRELIKKAIILEGSFKKLKFHLNLLVIKYFDRSVQLQISCLICSIKNQLLIELDQNITVNCNSFILCATNCPWDIDTAFMRRFQCRIFVPLPDK